jgi:ABC-type Fe2+-enterobactin transport system substrate-binding protein
MLSQVLYWQMMSLNGSTRLLLLIMKHSSRTKKLLTEVGTKLAEINQKVGQAEQDKKARDTLKAAQDRLPSETTAQAEAESALKAEKEKHA